MPFPSVTRRLTAGAVALLAASTLVACADSVAPTSPELRNPTGSFSEPEAGVLHFCKIGKAGTYYFRISVQGGGEYVLPRGSEFAFTLNADATEEFPVCGYAYAPINAASWANSGPATVTVEEILSATQTVDSIKVYQGGLLQSLVTGTSTAQFTSGYETITRVKFYNGEVEPPPPPMGGEGCTPGFWKARQHLAYWNSTGYTTGQSIGSVFPNAAGYTLGGASLASYSLLQGLTFQGGSTNSGAAEILLRAGVAALLNSAHADVDYGFTTAQVIADVNAALASNDRDTMLGLAGTLDLENNSGCTITK